MTTLVTLSTTDYYFFYNSVRDVDMVLYVVLVVAAG